METCLIDEGHDVRVLGRVEVDNVEAMPLTDVVTEAHEGSGACLWHPVIDDDRLVSGLLSFISG